MQASEEGDGPLHAEQFLYETGMTLHACGVETYTAILCVFVDACLLMHIRAD